MRGRLLRRLLRSERAAVAPTIGLSLFALIGVGGIAFDYARLAAMDSELQNAADQAALAAASQLDGDSGTCQRAVNAAISLVENNTRFANDDGGLAVTISDAEPCNDDGSISFDAESPIKFYSDKEKTTASESDADANFVEVTVDAREAFYALTPVVAAFSSGDIAATAYAGLGSAICKVPPVMICNPDEPEDNITDPDYDFNVSTRIGKGLKLASVGNGGGAWAPGNFGYLDTGSPTSNPNVELRQALGWMSVPGDCSSLDGVETRTGAGTTVTQAINTRFDIYEKANNNPQNGTGNNGNGNNTSCPSGGLCPPSINTVKDVVRKSAPPNGGKCGLTNNEWELPSKEYLPSSSSADLDLTNAANVPTAMGHPRDKCHAVSSAGTCGKVGDGDWDRNAYFYVNYGWTSSQWPANTNTSSDPLPSNPTRYEVYKWEIAHRGESIGGKTILSQRAFGSGSTAAIDYDAPVCSSIQSPSNGSGIVPGGSNIDRRRISAAVINCKYYNVHGGSDTVYPVLKWIELFLVEPSLNRTRTDANDVYVEVIGETTLGSDATAGQVVQRAVPYLIE